MNRLPTSQAVMSVRLIFWKSMVKIAEKALAHRTLVHKFNDYMPFLICGISAYAAGWVVGEILLAFLF